MPDDACFNILNADYDAGVCDPQWTDFWDYCEKHYTLEDGFSKSECNDVIDRINKIVEEIALEEVKA